MSWAMPKESNVRVADGRFDNTAGLLSGVDSEPHVVDVVERIEHTEDV